MNPSALSAVRGSFDFESDAEFLALPAPTISARLPLSEAVECFERRYIERALLFTGGHIGQACKDLGISPATYFRKTKQREP